MTFRRPRAEAGFTLAELVVVLFLLALVAALALPRLERGMETVELRAQAARFSAFLRYGREQAVTKGVAQEVRVDPATGVLTLTPAGGETPRATKQLSTRVRISVDSSAGMPAVTFSPEGFSSGASFRLEGPGGRAYRITVDPVTGRVSNRRETG